MNISFLLRTLPLTLACFASLSSVHLLASFIIKYASGSNYSSDRDTVKEAKRHYVTPGYVSVGHVRVPGRGIRGEMFTRTTQVAGKNKTKGYSSHFQYEFCNAFFFHSCNPTVAYAINFVPHAFVTFAIKQVTCSPFRRVTRVCIHNECNQVYHCRLAHTHTHTHRLMERKRPGEKEEEAKGKLQREKHPHWNLLTEKARESTTATGTK